MREQDEKSIKTGSIILAILSAVFIPFSVGRYDIPDSQCSKKTQESADIKPILGQNNKDCDNKGFHRAVFLGVNGVIFGLPVVVFALTLKRNRKH